MIDPADFNTFRWEYRVLVEQISNFRFNREFVNIGIYMVSLDESGNPSRILGNAIPCITSGDTVKAGSDYLTDIILGAQSALAKPYLQKETLLPMVDNAS